MPVSGKTISPVSGKEVKKHQVSDIVKEVLGYPAGTRFAVYAPVVLPDGRSIKEQLEILQKEGYTRLSINETVYRIGEVLADDALLSYPVIELLIDRLVVSDDKTLKSRLADSAETAFLRARYLYHPYLHIRRNGCKRIFQEIRGRWYGVRGTDRYDVQF